MLSVVTENISELLGHLAQNLFYFEINYWCCWKARSLIIFSIFPFFFKCLKPKMRSLCDTVFHLCKLSAFCMWLWYLSPVLLNTQCAICFIFGLSWHIFWQRVRILLLYKKQVKKIPFYNSICLNLTAYYHTFCILLHFFCTEGVRMSVKIQ